ncbi:ATP-binding cassette domain-containing protein [Aquabacterium sp.]|uniref:ATP-binding cassette domain-containing protein n=1 Tax=Aquabacterium sp. TaxID=1872578 RepID=UPI003783F4F7
MSATRLRRRWRIPEVVQTSAMDCGPATLAALLQGLGVPASYGRLREACQTGVDGSSIDSLEAAAVQLGVQAEQVLIPLDHVLLPAAQALPCVAVVRQPDGAPHFVVLWRRVGARVQVMDPAAGRQWWSAPLLAERLLVHRHSVPAEDWRAWAAGEDFLAPLRARITDLGLRPAAAAALVARACADEGWFALGALDAAVRWVSTLCRAGGLRRGRQAAALLRATAEAAWASGDDLHAVLPPRCWSVLPDADSLRLGRLHLVLHGAVLVRARGLAATVDEAATPELAAARREPVPRPLRVAWAELRRDGLLAPLALAGAVCLAAGALVVEAVLLRGLFDLAWQIGSAAQRLGGLLALVVFAALLLALEVPIVSESLRLGRHLASRGRMALLAKLPRLHDRYFASRTVGDMAERSHALQQLRQVPGLVLSLVQLAAELALTLAGLAWIVPAELGWAAAVAGVAVAWPLLLQPWQAERDLRVRLQATGLHSLLLDALLGAVPLRAHGAGAAMRREHERRLADWLRACRAQLHGGLVADALQALLCTGLTLGWLWRHFQGAGQVAGADLLLVYWALKLPVLAGRLAAAWRQLPAQRNVLARWLEPLAAPDEVTAAAAGAGSPPAGPMAGPDAVRPAALALHGARVLAGGHPVLSDLTLQIGAGEHVAIVGASGAGKSSLLGALLGWHRLAEGECRLDGRPLDAAGLAALRRATAWVEPGVQLWNRSLLDNLLYASDDTAVVRLAPALEAAGLHDLLRQLPQGLRTPLGDGGARLSGGQGQRVRLARALLQTGVRFVALDEAFRGLDRAQRSALLAAARQWWAGCTLACVTHDVVDTLDFDRVLVMAGGRVVEDGAPRALLAGAGRYAALLAAEDGLRRQAWAAPSWRHLRLVDGQLWDAVGGDTVAPPAPVRWPEPERRAV